MDPNHHCGGKFRRSDIIAVRNPRYPKHEKWPYYYQDTDKLVAHWTCDKCGAKRSQRKRQPKPKFQLHKEYVFNIRMEKSFRHGNMIYAAYPQFPADDLDVIAASYNFWDIVSRCARSILVQGL